MSDRPTISRWSCRCGATLTAAVAEAVPMCYACGGSFAPDSEPEDIYGGDPEPICAPTSSWSYDANGSPVS